MCINSELLFAISGRTHAAFFFLSFLVLLAKIVSLLAVRSLELVGRNLREREREGIQGQFARSLTPEFVFASSVSVFHIFSPLYRSPILKGFADIFSAYNVCKKVVELSDVKSSGRVCCEENSRLLLLLTAFFRDITTIIQQRESFFHALRGDKEKKLENFWMVMREIRALCVGL